MPKPELADVPQFYRGYIQQVTEDDLLSALKITASNTLHWLDLLSKEQWAHAYAPGKWTISEVVQHLIDAERIFAYRALCFARGEKTSLPGFDENNYAAASNATVRDIKKLREEFAVVRQGTTALFESFDYKQLLASGTANNSSISVSAIGFVIAGHTAHHLNVLRERYV